MLEVTGLPLILLLTLLKQVNSGGYEPSTREKNALVCIAGAVGDAVRLHDFASKARAEKLTAAIIKEANRQGVALALKAQFTSDAAKTASIKTTCNDDGSWHDITIPDGNMISLRHRSDLAEAKECTQATAEGLVTLAVAEKILAQRCGKEYIKGADEFMSALVPSTAIKQVQVLGEYGEPSDLEMRLEVTLCYDDFTKSLEQKLGQCDKVGISCESTNAVTKSSLSISCTKADKKSEITAEMLGACDRPGSRPEGQNKLVLLDLLDRICEVGISDTLAKETDPKRFQKLFTKSLTADALVAVVHPDQALVLYPKVAKDIEDFFRKPACNSEDFKLVDCDKDWPSEPSFRGGNACTLKLPRLIEINKKCTDALSNALLRQSRLLRSARKILCDGGLKDKSFKVEKPNALASKLGLKSKSELEKALETAVAKVKV